MQPELSIIICTYNREDFLPLTLQSLSLQSPDKHRYEVLVVDNNSTDRTASLCQKFIEHHPDINLRYFLEKNQGLAFARNRGIKESSGRIISFIDDDAEARSDYAMNLIRTFQEYSNYDAIGGKVIPLFPEKKEPAWLSKYIWGVVAKVDKGSGLVCPGCCGISPYPSGKDRCFRHQEIVPGFRILSPGLSPKPTRYFYIVEIF